MTEPPAASRRLVSRKTDAEGDACAEAPRRRRATSRMSQSGTGDPSPCSAGDGRAASGEAPALTASNLRLHERTRTQSMAIPRATSAIRSQGRPVRLSLGTPSAASSAYIAAVLPLNPSLAAAALALQSEQAPKGEHGSMIARFLKHGEKIGRGRWVTWAILLCVVFLVKWAVGLGGYSGEGVGPLFGDLEAQRHWMALTMHKPAGEWYFYDLEYWGLDYPPLTAYHSLLLGYLARLIHPSFIGLRPLDLSTGSGWGDLHPSLKVYLRSTVILSDALVWVPAVFAFCTVSLGRPHTQGGKRRSWRTQSIAALSLLLHPALILIDNGHFQYNSVMLGFTLGAVVCFYAGRDLLGAVLFVSSLGFKQMALYYSPAVFAYLLGKCLYLPHPHGVNLFVQLSLVTTVSFLLLFSPFLVYPSFPLGMFQALFRIFPVARGLFEDKVANAWCALNVVVKLRAMAAPTTLAKLALAATSLAVLPGVASMLSASHRLGKTTAGINYRSVPQTVRLLPHTLFVSSMAFFLFSFQVHEKSILLPWLAAAMVGAGKEPGAGGRDWEWSVLVGNVAVFSMGPLLKRDGQALQAVALTLFYNYAIGYNPFALGHCFVKYLSIGVYSFILALGVLEATAMPPAHLKDLFVVLNVELSCAVFGLSWLWGLKRQIQQSWALGGLDFSPAPRGGAAEVDKPASPVRSVPATPFPPEYAPLSDASGAGPGASLQAAPRSRSLVRSSPHPPDSRDTANSRFNGSGAEDELGRAERRRERLRRKREKEQNEDGRPAADGSGSCGPSEGSSRFEGQKVSSGRGDSAIRDDREGAVRSRKPSSRTRNEGSRSEGSRLSRRMGSVQEGNL